MKDFRDHTVVIYIKECVYCFFMLYNLQVCLLQLCSLVADDKMVVAEGGTCVTIAAAFHQQLLHTLQIKVSCLFEETNFLGEENVSYFDNVCLNKLSSDHALIRRCLTFDKNNYFPFATSVSLLIALQVRTEQPFSLYNY